MKKLCSLVLAMLLLLSSFGTLYASAEAVAEEEEKVSSWADYSAGSFSISAPADWNIEVLSTYGFGVEFGSRSLLKMEIAYDNQNNLPGIPDDAVNYGQMLLGVIELGMPESLDHYECRLNGLDTDIYYARKLQAMEGGDFLLMIVANETAGGVIYCEMYDDDFFTYRTDLLGMLLSVSVKAQDDAAEAEGEEDGAADEPAEEAEEAAAEETVPEAEDGEASEDEGGEEPAVWAEKGACGISFRVPEDWTEEEGNDEGFYRFMFGESSMFSLAAVPLAAVKEEYDSVEDFLEDLDSGMETMAGALGVDVFEQYKPFTLNGIEIHMFYLSHMAAAQDQITDYIRFTFAGAEGAGMASFNYLEQSIESFPQLFLGVLTSMASVDEAPEEDAEEEAGPEEDTQEGSAEPEDDGQYAEEEAEIEGREIVLNNAELGENYTGTVEGEVLLYDEDGIRITLQELAYSDYYAELKVNIINGSDHRICVSSGWDKGRMKNSINGMMLPDTLGSTYLEAGQEELQSYELWYSELRGRGIMSIEELTLGFEIENEDDLNAETIYTEPVTVQTSIYGSGEEGKLTEDEIIHNQALHQDLYFDLIFDGGDPGLEADGVKICGYYIVDSWLEGRMIYLLAENVSEEEKVVSFGNLFVNGISVRQSSAGLSNILPGKKAVLTTGIDRTASTDLLPMIGIEDVYEVMTELQISDSEGQVLHGYKLRAVLNPEMKEAAGAWEISGKVMYEDDELRITASDILADPKTENAAHILYLVENKTDRRLTADIDAWAGHINGEEVYLSCYPTDVYPEGTGLLDCAIWESEFSELNISIDDIREIDMVITAEYAGGKTERIRMQFDLEEE